MILGMFLLPFEVRIFGLRQCRFTAPKHEFSESPADWLAPFLPVELSRRADPSFSNRRAAKMRPGSDLSTFKGPA
jgi:hypothetical protein